ncbi:peroxiredoxin [Patescibacteria group bacterium]
MKLSMGDLAPDFVALDQHGKEHRLGDYAESWLILYFYPRDNTPGCIKEACGFRDDYEKLIQHASVVGVSSDSVNSHKKFAEKYSLPFVLLSDPKREMLGDYGADGLIFAKRTTFVINPEGKIAKIYEKVSPDTHSQELLEYLKSLSL